MSDSNPKSSPNHAPEKTTGKVFGYNVAQEARRAPEQKPNPNSPLAAG